MSTALQKAHRALQAGKPGEAERILLKNSNRSEQEFRLLVEVLVLSNKNKQAVHLARQGLSKHQGTQSDTGFLLLVAGAYAAENKIEEAIHLLEKSVDFCKSFENARSVLALTEAYASQYNLRAVEQLAPLLLEWPDYQLRGSFLLMENAARLGNRELLVARCKNLIPRCRSLSAADFSVFIDHLIRAGCLDESQDLLTRMESDAGRTLPVLRSSIELEMRNYDRVVEYLSDEVLLKYPPGHFIKGLALDRLGRFDSAFEHFSRAARFRTSRLQGNNKSDLLEFHKLMDDEPFVRQCLCTKGSADYPGIAFIFGFPRSGTTLLENVLDTQSQLQVLPERPALFFVKQAISGKLGYEYPQELKKLTQDDRQFLRDLYFEKVQELGFEPNSKGMVVDKGPHHTIDLPLIRLLFPQARLILSLRHPQDVVLSCFQQDFELNQNTRMLFALDDIIKRYIQVFSLYEVYVNKLQLEVLEVKYEKLVTDFDQQIDAVFQFLGISPVENFRDYQSHSVKKFIQSSSRGQADQPIYASSVGRWKNYESYLKPCIPDLMHFCERFSYET